MAIQPGVFNVQQFTDTGALAASYRLYTYAQGTTSHKTAYTDAAELVAHTYTSDGIGGQFIALNARGELPAPLYLTDGGYSIALKTPAGATVWTRPVDSDVGGGDLINVLSYGADPTGVLDSATAFTNAAATGKLVWRPKGTYKRGAVTRTYITDGFEGVLWVGNGNVNYSDDAQVVISRDVDATGSGNGHAFTDSSAINRTGGISYNSFDARIKFSGSHSYGHYAAFQVGCEFGASGTVSDLFSFITSPVVSNGTLTNYYGLSVNAPTINAPGTVTNCYGVYFPLGYGKGGPGFNQSTGLVFAMFNESQAMVYSRGPVQGADGLIAGGGAGSSYVNVKTIDAVTAPGTLAGMRLQQLATQQLDIEIPAGQIYATVSNVAGEILRWDAAKNMILRPATTAPALTANGQLVFNPTSDTNLRISYRGSDGVTRVANIALA